MRSTIASRLGRSGLVMPASQSRLRFRTSGSALEGTMDDSLPTRAWIGNQVKARGAHGNQAHESHTTGGRGFQRVGGCGCLTKTAAAPLLPVATATSSDFSAVRMAYQADARSLVPTARRLELQKPPRSKASCPLTGLGARSIVQRRDRHQASETARFSRRPAATFQSRLPPKHGKRSLTGAPPGCSTVQIRRFDKYLILWDFFAAENQWRREWDSHPR
jgi:hypothetical protein